MMRHAHILLALLFAFTAVINIAAVRQGDFKKCQDSSFCRRIRRLSSYVESHSHTAGQSSFASPYSLDKDTITFDPVQARLTASVKSALHPSVSFDLQIFFYHDGSSRIKLNQGGEAYKGWKRYDEAAAWAIEQQPMPAEPGTVDVQTRGVGETFVTFGPAGINSLSLHHNPVKAIISRAGVPQVVLNERGLLHMEHYRPKPDPFPSAKQEEGEAPSLVFQNRKRDLEAAGHSSRHSHLWSEFEQEDDGEWEETFNGRKDTKPKGPEAFSLDVEFPGKTYLFGLPEHASPLNLRSTRGQDEDDFQEPYRLMNTDVFEYDHNSPMSLYGSVPVLHAQAPSSAVSVLWLAASETWVDIDRAGTGKGAKARAHFFSESGILDLWIFLKASPADNLATLAELTGRTPLPAYFALGYHQCRWNYLTTDDVLSVNRRFSEEDIPVDVLWLDIEYAKNHWYAVWNEETFAEPERMLTGLDAESRKLVIIIDPHLARNDEYFLYDEARKLDLFVKDPDRKKDYEGWCWSGSASWLDHLNPNFWKWWVSLFNIASQKIRANARNMHFWLDMNEPAIFNGPEITAPKDVIHHGGWEHRDIHNLYAAIYHNASAAAVKAREAPNHRPFLLARGWWIGTWKAGAIWTGDNLGSWEHLAVSVPMILANNIGGMSFCGADVGGFFGNPPPDFLVRWYQAGIFEPFFRAHAHIDTKRREPYLLPEPMKSAVRELIKLRYRMLPMWYTAFKESSVSGLPVLRPQFLAFPHDDKGFGIDDQYFIGDSGLLVKPAVRPDSTTVDIYLAEDQPYYHFFSHEVFLGSKTGKRVTVAAPLTGEVPLLLRGGSVLPLRQRARRAAELGWRDPVTLIVALNKPDTASEASGGLGTLRATGKLYLDDGDTYGFQEGHFVWRRFDWITEKSGQHVFRSEHAHEKFVGHPPQTSSAIETLPNSANNFARAIEDVRVERLIVLGLEKQPSSVYAIDADSGERRKLDFIWSTGVSASGHGIRLGQDKQSSRLIVKDPALKIIQDWKLEVH